MQEFAYVNSIEHGKRLEMGKLHSLAAILPLSWHIYYTDNAGNNYIYKVNVQYVISAKCINLSLK